MITSTIVVLERTIVDSDVLSDCGRRQADSKWIACSQLIFKRIFSEWNMIVPVGDWLILALNRSVANIVSSLVISEVGAIWSADKFSYSTYFKLNFFVFNEVHFVACDWWPLLLSFYWPTTSTHSDHLSFFFCFKGNFLTTKFTTYALSWFLQVFLVILIRSDFPWFPLQSMISFPWLPWSSLHQSIYIAHLSAKKWEWLST